MFLMDEIVRGLVDFECQKYAPKCPYLARAEIEALILGQLEADGTAMRYLRRDDNTIAWKATPKMRKKAADYEAEMLEAEDDD
jgi:hypothetical protein